MLQLLYQFLMTQLCQTLIITFPRHSIVLVYVCDNVSVRSHVVNLSSSNAEFWRRNKCGHLLISDGSLQCRLPTAIQQISVYRVIPKLYSELKHSRLYSISFIHWATWPAMGHVDVSTVTCCRGGDQFLPWQPDVVPCGLEWLLYGDTKVTNSNKIQQI